MPAGYLTHRARARGSPLCTGAAAGAGPGPFPSHPGPGFPAVPAPSTAR
jgi:hypothetical protein